MQKQIEISFDGTIPALQVRKNILRLQGISKCAISAPQTVTVSYDEAQVMAKLIVKAAGFIPRMRRRANITSVRELSTTQ